MCVLSRFISTTLMLACVVPASHCPPCAADASVAIPERIISLAPSTTEELYVLGLGHKVVGVTRFCDYPEAVKSTPEVGGYVDPNYKAIVALQPDLTILLTSHQDAEQELAISHGVAVNHIKTLLFFSISILVGIIVSVCGPVGLMCPHICRLLGGPIFLWLLLYPRKAANCTL